MKNMLILLTFTVLSIFQSNKASASINQDYQYNGDVKFYWTGPWCVEPKKSWDDKHYQFHIKKSGKLTWDIVRNVSALSPDYRSTTINADYFDADTEYTVKVQYHGRRKDCGQNQATIVRQLGKINFQYDFQPEVPSDAVRIKNMSFGKCIYPYNPGTGIRFHNYGCWDDPAFAFIVEPAGGLNEVKLKSPAADNLCLMPVDDSIYGEITAGSCTSVYAVYEIHFVGADTFRLRNKVRNKCLYGSPDDGGKVRDFGCWANPDMIFKFENY